MKTQTKTIQLNLQGVDNASETIQSWLTAAGVEHKDILRIRLTMEQMLTEVCDHAETPGEAELRFSKRLGDRMLRVRYGGDRFDPTAPQENELESWSASLLARIGFVPEWRWRAKRNELTFRIPGREHRSELIMLGCFIAAVIIGLLGQALPEAVKTGVTDYGLSFLSAAFLNLLRTFIGLLIFLSIITGICGIGSASSFGRIGKVMITRFVLSTVIICALLVVIIRFLFPLGAGEGSGSIQLRAILEMIFGIIPVNPVQPFIDGNTLQLVFLGTIIGVVLLLTGSETEGIRNLAAQGQKVLTQCVRGVCLFMPVFIFTSLVQLFWGSGTGVILELWKPLVICLGLSVVMLAGYLFCVCRKLKVKASVLIPKLAPDFLIALTTSSSAAAFSTSIDINENKLGIDSSYSRMGVPIGAILFAGSFSLLYVLAGAFLAEHYGLQVSAAWWIILWIACALFAMATPPVSGGMISCLSILILQMGIPEEGLALGATLTLLMDFIATSCRVPILHCEMLLQADRLKLLDHEVLRRKG